MDMGSVLMVVGWGRGMGGERRGLRSTIGSYRIAMGMYRTV